MRSAPLAGRQCVSRRPLQILTNTVRRWPAARQLLDGAPANDVSVTARTQAQRSRLHGTHPVPSVCPYCAVGCATLVHVKDGQIVDIEGDPASPINEGTLCPKGADTFQYTVNPNRLTRCLYRRPYGTAWETVSLEWAMDRIAERFRETRDRTWRDRSDSGPARHTEAIGFLGGAALDNEENYLIKKFCVGTGIVFVENQARI
jgi:formate dehydrogenase major subunit